MDSWKPVTKEYAEGVGAYLARDFLNPYNRDAERDKWVEWENGYNDTHIETVYSQTKKGDTITLQDGFGTFTIQL